MRPGRHGFAAALLGGALAAVCATNPVTQNRELMLVSEAQEIQLGREGARDADATYGLVADSFRGVADRLAAGLAGSTWSPSSGHERERVCGPLSLGRGRAHARTPQRRRGGRPPV